MAQKLFASWIEFELISHSHSPYQKFSTPLAPYKPTKKIDRKLRIKSKLIKKCNLSFCLFLFNKCIWQSQCRRRSNGDDSPTSTGSLHRRAAPWRVKLSFLWTKLNFLTRSAQRWGKRHCREHLVFFVLCPKDTSGFCILREKWNWLDYAMHCCIYQAFYVIFFKKPCQFVKLKQSRKVEWVIIPSLLRIFPPKTLSIFNKLTSSGKKRDYFRVFCPFTAILFVCTLDPKNNDLLNLHLC